MRDKIVDDDWCINDQDRIDELQVVFIFEVNYCTSSSNEMKHNKNIEYSRVVLASNGLILNQRMVLDKPDRQSSSYIAKHEQACQRKTNVNP